MDVLSLKFDASENSLRDDSILLELIRLKTDSTVVIPDGPGLGVEIDEEKLFRYD